MAGEPTDPDLAYIAALRSLDAAIKSLSVTADCLAFALAGVKAVIQATGKPSEELATGPCEFLERIEAWPSLDLLRHQVEEAVNQFVATSDAARQAGKDVRRWVVFLPEHSR